MVYILDWMVLGTPRGFTFKIQNHFEVKSKVMILISIGIVHFSKLILLTTRPPNEIADMEFEQLLSRLPKDIVKCSFPV